MVRLWPGLRWGRCSRLFTSRNVSTVFALSSGQGKCGVGLVRVTGDRAREVFTRMTHPPTLPTPRVATLKRIIHPASGEGLDRGLVLWFPGPHSFTGEDSCELHVHGGLAVITAVLSALSTLPGFTPAKPGTTRDVVETVVDLGGYPVVVSDTAGLRKTDDVVEMEGVRRAVAKARQADMALVVLEASQVLQAVRAGNFNCHHHLNTHLTQLGIIKDDNKCEDSGNAESMTPEWIKSTSYVTLINKIDLVNDKHDRDLLSSALEESCVLLSLKTQEGFDSSLQKVKDLCASLCDVGLSENPTLTAARHRTHISACLDSLRRILYPSNEWKDNSRVSNRSVLDLENSSSSVTAKLHTQKDPRSSLGSNLLLENNLNARFKEESEGEGEVSLLQYEGTLLAAAHHLQCAATNLGHVTGQITTEDILNQIFSAFCIGK